MSYYLGSSLFLPSPRSAFPDTLDLHRVLGGCWVAMRRLHRRFPNAGGLDDRLSDGGGCLFVFAVILANRCPKTVLAPIRAND